MQISVGEPELIKKYREPEPLYIFRGGRTFFEGAGIGAGKRNL
jgi:hypothetical protein